MTEQGESTAGPPSQTPESGPGARLPRSYLYAPAHRVELLEKALVGEADVAIADLEDAVPEDRKQLARANVVGLLRERPGQALQVRVNPSTTPAGRADLRALVEVCGETGATLTVRLPKVEGPEDVALAADAGACLRFVCLLESALGVERAHAIASVPTVEGIALGEADLRADLGLGAGDLGLSYARCRCVLAARVARLAPPAASVYARLRDPRGLRASSELMRELGFHGRAAIHPEQVPVINEVFAPSAEELADAQALLDAYAERSATGSATMPDGRFVDVAAVRSASRLLAEAGGEETGGGRWSR